MVSHLKAISLSRDIIEAENELFLKEVTNGEILKTVKQVNSLKASGSNAIQSIYEKNLGIIGKSICSMVGSSFNSSHVLKELNRTYITFVPKNDNLDSINHYRPN